MRHAGRQTECQAIRDNLPLEAGRLPTHALDMAFRFDTEAVYFLSDVPNCGQIVDPNAIVDAVTQANRSRRISLNSIGILSGEPGGPLDSFMKTLAKQNFGDYRRVEQ